MGCASRPCSVNHSPSAVSSGTDSLWRRARRSSAESPGAGLDPVEELPDAGQPGQKHDLDRGPGPGRDRFEIDHPHQLEGRSRVGQLS
jgi:hypothetical protein